MNDLEAKQSGAPVIEPGAFGIRLGALRAQAGLSLAELARRASLTVDAISRLEHGSRRQPNWETVLALAHALGVSLEAFRAESVIRAGLQRGRTVAQSDGERLRDWRINQGLSMSQAGARLRMTRQAWEQWERKRRIPPERMAQLMGEIEEVRS